MELPVPAQTLEFDDYKNDTQYEEYEEYEDNFKFAERDRAETWDGEVILSRRLNLTDKPAKTFCDY